MNNQEPIYITGHMHPDTDSVAAAIAYAFYKRALGIKAIPCRLGRLNQETKYLLDKFGFDEPVLLEDARKTLGEISMDSPISVTMEDTIGDTIAIMNREKRQSLAVVDENGKMVGMVSRNDLASLSLGDTAGQIDLISKTSVTNIAKAISGTLVYDDPQSHLNGKISIIALTSTKLENYETKDRIVIIGDDAESQKELIEKGAGMLIIVWAKSVDDSVLEAAKIYHCPIVLSGHGSMNTSRYIYFAPPIRLVMKENQKLILFRTSELAEDAGRKMMQSRFRTYPVLDKDDRLAGYVSRYHIMNYRNKKIILVDHNEFSQSVRAVEKAQLLEVIDHHRINDFSTSQPVSFRNEIVGSTATIIAGMYRENQVPIPANIAGLLLGAILSDTLMFQSPTTTDKDRQVANILAALSNLDIDDFGTEMFSMQAVDPDKDIREILSTDVKYFDIYNSHAMVSQTVVSSTEEIKKRDKEIVQAMRSIVKNKDLDLLVVCFTSVMENGSIFYVDGEMAKAIDCFPDNPGETHSLQKGILSRKSQILPMLNEALYNF